MNVERGQLDGQRLFGPPRCLSWRVRAPICLLRGLFVPAWSSVSGSKQRLGADPHPPPIRPRSDAQLDDPHFVRKVSPARPVPLHLGQQARGKRMAAARHRTKDEHLSLFASESHPDPKKRRPRLVAAEPKEASVDLARPPAPAVAPAPAPSSGQPPRGRAPKPATAAGDGDAGRMYTIEESAKICHVSTKTITRYIKKGELVAHKVGHSVRIWPEDLHRWIHGTSGDGPVDGTAPPRPSRRPIDPAAAVPREDEGGEA